MPNLFRLSILAAVLTLPGVAHAQDRLDLVVQRADTTDSLILWRAGVDYEGQLTRNGITMFAFATYSGNTFYVQLGDQVADLTILPESPTTNRYVGNFDGARPVDLSAEVTANGRKVVLEGTVGAFDVTATLQDQGLRLFWDDNKLILSRDENGTCSGEIRRRGESSPVDCATFGTLTDALFTNTDIFLGFLVNLVVR